MNSKWYMIRVVSGKEKQAIENLKAELRVHELEKYVTNLVLPKARTIVKVKGKNVNRDKLTFPGWLLIEAEMAGELPRTIKRTNLVRGFAGDVNGNPVSLKQAEVDKIFFDMDKSYSEEGFLKGDEITIKEGAFTGFKATVENVLEDKKKLELSVIIFGRHTPLEMTFEQVEKNKN